MASSSYCCFCGRRETSWLPGENDVCQPEAPAASLVDKLRTLPSQRWLTRKGLPFLSRKAWAISSSMKTPEPIGEGNAAFPALRCRRNFASQSLDFQPAGVRSGGSFPRPETLPPGPLRRRAPARLVSSLAKEQHDVARVDQRFEVAETRAAGKMIAVAAVVAFTAILFRHGLSRSLGSAVKMAARVVGPIAGRRR